MCGSTISIGSSTLSSVVRQGISVGFWNAMPTPLIGRVTFWPADHAPRRSMAGNSPVTSFMMVDLPQPDGPDDGDELALVDADRGIGQGERRFLAETVGEADGLEVDERHVSARSAPLHEPLFSRPLAALRPRSQRRSFATIRSALGGRYLLVKTLSGAGAAGRPNASDTSLTDLAKRAGSTSPMPLALT